MAGHTIQYEKITLEFTAYCNGFSWFCSGQVKYYYNQYKG